MSKWYRYPTKWIFNVLIAIDQFGNAIAGGDPDETVSSRIGKIKRAHGGRVPWKKPVSKLLDSLLEVIDKDHCIEAIEEDEGDDNVRT